MWPSRLSSDENNHYDDPKILSALQGVYFTVKDIIYGNEMHPLLEHWEMFHKAATTPGNTFIIPSKRSLSFVAIFKVPVLDSDCGPLVDLLAELDHEQAIPYTQ